jgi:WD40 repeat protein
MDAPIFGASVSSNGTCAVACGSEISLFKFGEWRKFFTYTESHLDNVSCLKFSTQHPDFLVSGGDDGLVNVYNTSDLVNEDNGQCPVITLNAEDSVRSFQLCGDKMFVFSTTESVSVWDTKSGTKIRPNEDSLRCHPLVASDETGWGYIVGMDQEGRKILVGNSAGKLVEFEDLQVSKIYDAAHSGVVRSCLYTRSGTVLTAGEDGYLYEWTESVAQQHFSGESVRSRSARSSASSRPY